MKRRSLIMREGMLGTVPGDRQPWSLEALGVEWRHWILGLVLHLNQGG